HCGYIKGAVNHAVNSHRAPLACTRPQHTTTLRYILLAEMTRSASPNGAVEFSYDFPVAGPSTLPPKTPRCTRTRACAASPSSASASSSASSLTQLQSSQRTRPRWEASPSAFDEEDAELEADTDNYPRAGRTRPIPVPAPTRNQWLAPTNSTSPTYPYGGYTYAYDYPPMLMAPQPSSCESAVSALSATSASSYHHYSHDAHKEKRGLHVPAKFRKARRSVDEERPAWDSYDAPQFPSYTPQYVDSPRSSPTLDLDDEEEEQEGEQEEEEPQQPASHECASLTLRRHWTALSLRVRFGVFRAKRRMRARVMSL
ncbi:hypothetical protein B0H16DRAFT_63527, partial [Mycena metata]